MMNTTLRNGALALVLAGSTMLATAPAKANSIHDEGYFGGSWTSIGPSNYAEHRNGGRIGPLYGHRLYRYYGPAPYAYYGGPAPPPPFYSSFLLPPPPLPPPPPPPILL